MYFGNRYHHQNRLFRILDPQPTLKSVEAIDTTDFKDGVQVFVLENRRDYALDRTSTATADGAATLAPDKGPGRWIRQPLYDGGEPEEGVVYVSKNGNDEQSGTNPMFPKLTLSAAIATAQARTPTDAAQQTVHILDGGTYTESFTLPEYVSLYGPAARLVGAYVLTRGNDVEIRSAQGLTNEHVFFKETAGVARVRARLVSCEGSGQAFLNILTGSILMVRVDTIFVNGAGVGVGTITGNGHTHVRAGDIYLAGDGSAGLAMAFAGTLVAQIEHIIEIGTNGIAVAMSAGEIDLVVSHIDATEAWNVSGGTLRIVGAHVDGTQTTSGGGTALSLIPT